VAYRDHGSPSLRENAEIGYIEEITLIDTDPDVPDEHEVAKYSPNSNILRSLLDLSKLVVPGFWPGQITAIEERVSIYKVEEKGCRFGTL
jgi:hypothetical protein